MKPIFFHRLIFEFCCFLDMGVIIIKKKNHNLRDQSILHNIQPLFFVKNNTFSYRVFLIKYQKILK